MSDKHCSDEALVAHLDRELSSRVERHVAAHLAACWHCRSRAADLEAQVHKLSRSLGEQSYPGPDWVQSARIAFAERRRRIDAETRALPPASFFAWLRPARTFLLAASALIVLAAAWLYLTRTAPDPVAIAARAGEHEAAVLAKPVHLVYGVQIAQLKPAVRVGTSSLKIWSDRSSRRFASRWEEANGTLKFAVWHGARGKEFVYDPAIRPDVATRRAEPSAAVSIADIASAGLDPDQISRGFMGWIGGREWRPLFFGADLRTFTDQRDTILQVRRTHSADGRPLLRFIAHRTRPGITVAITIDLDPDTYGASVQRIRFESAGRAIELTLTAELSEDLTPERFQPAVFEPDFPTADPGFAAPAPLATPAPRSLETASPVAPGVFESEHATRELEVLYALHRLGACEGEAIEVVDGPNGWPAVRGVVRSSARKQQLLAAFEQLPGRAEVDVDIKASDEILASSKAPGPIAGTSSAPDEPLRQTTIISSERLPIEAPLRAYLEENRTLRQQTPAGATQPELDRSVAQFAADAVTQSESMFSQAWALRALVERLGEHRSGLLRAAAQTQLETMLRDHLTSLEQRSLELRRFLQPLLVRVAENRGQPADEQFAAAGLPLRQSVLEAFGVAKEIHDGVHFLFAGTRLAETSREPAVAGRVLLDLDRLQTDVQETSNRLSSNLFGKGRP